MSKPRQSTFYITKITGFVPRNSLFFFVLSLRFSSCPHSSSFQLCLVFHFLQLVLTTTYHSVVSISEISLFCILNIEILTRILWKTPILAEFFCDLLNFVVFFMFKHIVHLLPASVSPFLTIHCTSLQSLILPVVLYLL